MVLVRAAFLVLGFAVAGSFPSSAFADQVIPPPDSKWWGEENATQSLLNMNHDPDTVGGDAVDSGNIPVPPRPGSGCKGKDPKSCDNGRQTL